MESANPNARTNAPGSHARKSVERRSHGFCVPLLRKSLAVQERGETKYNIQYRTRNIQYPKEGRIPSGLMIIDVGFAHNPIRDLTQMNTDFHRLNKNNTPRELQS
jgi:hypothetical protein